jgi:hypothetical protein
LIHNELDFEALQTFMRYLFVSQWCCVVKADAEAILALAYKILPSGGNAVNQLASVWKKKALEEEDVNQGLVCPDEFFLSTLLTCSPRALDHNKMNAGETTATFYPFRQRTPHPLAWDAVTQKCVTELRFFTKATLEQKGATNPYGPAVEIDIYGAVFLAAFQRRALMSCENLLFLRKVRIREPLEPRALFDPVDNALATFRKSDVHQILEQSSWLREHMTRLCGTFEELTPGSEEDKRNKMEMAALNDRYFRLKANALEQLERWEAPGASSAQGRRASDPPPADPRMRNRSRSRSRARILGHFDCHKVSSGTLRASWSLFFTFCSASSANPSRAASDLNSPRSGACASAAPSEPPLPEPGARATSANARCLPRLAASL